VEQSRRNQRQPLAKARAVKRPLQSRLSRRAAVYRPVSKGKEGAAHRARSDAPPGHLPQLSAWNIGMYEMPTTAPSGDCSLATV
jgi:hypothetical protein